MNANYSPKVVAITGHRPQKIGGYDKFSPQRIVIYKQLEAFISSQLPLGKTTLVVGGALGVDTDAVEIALKIGMPYILCAPCTNQDSPWR